MKKALSLILLLAFLLSSMAGCQTAAPAPRHPVSPQPSRKHLPVKSLPVKRLPVKPAPRN